MSQEDEIGDAEVGTFALFLVAGLLIIVLCCGGYFVHEKIKNDRSIAADTHSIALSLERLSRH